MTGGGLNNNNGEPGTTMQIRGDGSCAPRAEIARLLFEGFKSEEKRGAVIDFFREIIHAHAHAVNSIKEYETKLNWEFKHKNQSDIWMEYENFFNEYKNLKTKNDAKNFINKYFPKHEPGTTRVSPDEDKISLLAESLRADLKYFTIENGRILYDRDNNPIEIKEYEDLDEQDKNDLEWNKDMEASLFSREFYNKKDTLRKVGITSAAVINRGQEPVSENQLALRFVPKIKAVEAVKASEGVEAVEAVKASEGVEAVEAVKGQDAHFNLDVPKDAYDSIERAKEIHGDVNKEIREIEGRTKNNNNEQQIDVPTRSRSNSTSEEKIIDQKPFGKELEREEVTVGEYTQIPTQQAPNEAAEKKPATIQEKKEEKKEENNDGDWPTDGNDRGTTEHFVINPEAVKSAYTSKKTNTSGNTNSNVQVYTSTEEKKPEGAYTTRRKQRKESKSETENITALPKNTQISPSDEAIRVVTEFKNSLSSKGQVKNDGLDNPGANRRSPEKESLLEAVIAGAYKRRELGGLDEDENNESTNMNQENNSKLEQALADAKHIVNALREAIDGKPFVNRENETIRSLKSKISEHQIKLQDLNNISDEADKLSAVEKLKESAIETFEILVQAKNNLNRPLKPTKISELESRLNSKNQSEYEKSSVKFSMIESLNNIIAELQSGDSLTSEKKQEISNRILGFLLSANLDESVKDDVYNILEKNEDLIANAELPDAELNEEQRFNLNEKLSLEDSKLAEKKIQIEKAVQSEKELADKHKGEMENENKEISGLDEIVSELENRITDAKNVFEKKYAASGDKNNPEERGNTAAESAKKPDQAVEKTPSQPRAKTGIDENLLSVEFDNISKSEPATLKNAAADKAAADKAAADKAAADKAAADKAAADKAAADKTAADKAAADKAAADKAAADKAVVDKAAAKKEAEPAAEAKQTAEQSEIDTLFERYKAKVGELNKKAEESYDLCQNTHNQMGVVAASDKGPMSKIKSKIITILKSRDGLEKLNNIKYDNFRNALVSSSMVVMQDQRGKLKATFDYLKKLENPNYKQNLIYDKRTDEAIKSSLEDEFKLIQNNIDTLNAYDLEPKKYAEKYSALNSYFGTVLDQLNSNSSVERANELLGKIENLIKEPINDTFFSNLPSHLEALNDSKIAATATKPAAGNPAEEKVEPSTTKGNTDEDLPPPKPSKPAGLGEKLAAAAKAELTAEPAKQNEPQAPPSKYALAYIKSLEKSMTPGTNEYGGKIPELKILEKNKKKPDQFLADILYIINFSKKVIENNKGNIFDKLGKGLERAELQLENSQVTTSKQRVLECYKLAEKEYSDAIKLAIETSRTDLVTISLASLETKINPSTPEVDEGTKYSKAGLGLITGNPKSEEDDETAPIPPPREYNTTYDGVVASEQSKPVAADITKTAKTTPFADLMNAIRKPEPKSASSEGRNESEILETQYKKTGIASKVEDNLALTAQEQEIKDRYDAMIAAKATPDPKTTVTADATGGVDTNSPGAETPQGQKAAIKKSDPREDIFGGGPFETIARLLNSRFFSINRYYILDRPANVIGSALIKAPLLAVGFVGSKIAQQVTKGDKERSDGWGNYANKLGAEALGCASPTSLAINMKRLITGEPLYGQAGIYEARAANWDLDNGRPIDPNLQGSLTLMQYDVQKMLQANFNMQKMDDAINAKKPAEEVVQQYFKTVEDSQHAPSVTIRKDLVARAAEIVISYDLGEKYDAVPEREIEFRAAVAENNFSHPAYKAFRKGEVPFAEFLRMKDPAAATATPDPATPTDPAGATATLLKVKTNPTL